LKRDEKPGACEDNGKPLAASCGGKIYIEESEL